MNKTIPFAIAAITVLALGGCKKDSVAPSTTTPPAGADVDATVGMTFHFKDGNAPFLLQSTVLQDSLGHNIILDQMRFFVSGIHAFNDVEAVIGHYEGSYLLVDAAHADTLFTVGPIHASHIHEFHFDLGLDAAANATDPNGAAAPLNDPSMYFDPAIGHKFLVASGHADLDGDGTYETEVNYACGMSTALTGAHAHVHHDLTAGELFNAQLAVDMGLLFTGIDLGVDNTPTMDAPASLRMMRNLSAAIDGME